MLHKFEILIIIIKNTNVSNLRDLILVIAKYSPSNLLLIQKPFLSVTLILHLKICKQIEYIVKGQNI